MGEVDYTRFNEILREADEDFRKDVAYAAAVAKAARTSVRKSRRSKLD
jgi:hypothetical protein